MDRPLSIIEARVLGCLIEKEITTPEYYPLTLNALTAACNQKSNRDPQMHVADTEVLRALDSLRERKLAGEVASDVGRWPKYRHNAKEALSLSPHQTALLCELLVRGAQTVGELRTHAPRLATFTDAQHIAATLGELMAQPDNPLVAILPHVTGQREQRYAHLLCGPVGTDGAQPSTTKSARLVVMAENERIAKLEAEVESLWDEVEKLKAQLAAIASELK